MHILLVRFSSMGDVVLQTSVVLWLKSFYGDNLTVTFVTSEEFSPLVRGIPLINRVISFDRKKSSLSDLFREIKSLHRSTPIDLILDLHGTTRSFLLRQYFWMIPDFVVDKRRIERFFLCLPAPLWFKRCFDLSFWGLEPQVKRVINDISFLFQETRGVRRAINRKNCPLETLTLSPIGASKITHPRRVVIAPSASFETKRWPVKNYLQLTKMILAETDFDIYILAGPQDDFCRVFDELKSSRVFNLQGKTNLQGSIDVLSTASLCIGNDSGMNHISESLGTPCLTIFGATDPRFGFTPHGKKSRFISKEMWCKPCSQTGKKNCFRSKLHCLEEITVAEVHAVVGEMLEDIT